MGVSLNDMSEIPCYHMGDRASASKIITVIFSMVVKQSIQLYDLAQIC